MFTTCFGSLQAITRLFRIIEDVTSPAFVVEDRQWRSSVIDVFRYFFGALWEDERVRSGPWCYDVSLTDMSFSGGDQISSGHVVTNTAGRPLRCHWFVLGRGCSEIPCRRSHDAGLVLESTSTTLPSMAL